VPVETPSIPQEKSATKTFGADGQPTPSEARANSISQQPKVDQGAGAAARLLRLETDLRRIRAADAVGFFVANETRQVTKSQQTFVLGLDRLGKICVTAVSALVTVDRSAPLIVWVEALLFEIEKECTLNAVREFDAHGIELSPGVKQASYPLKFMVWLPFLDMQGKLIGGMLQAKTAPWSESDLVVSKHVADACAHAYIALNANVRSPSFTFSIKPRFVGATAAVLIAVGCVPVSMTALAPVEVSPRSSFVVTAPVEGVVDAVLVQPNSAVRKDQPLVRLSDTILRNRLDIADREVMVAEAKAKKSAQLAFVDVRGRHELGIAQAEHELRRAERDYAKELLDRSVVRADRDGIAFFADAKDLIGRPVAVGERLMELADPALLEFRIDLPVADAIVLRDATRVKIFLDSSPFDPIEAKLIRTDFQARQRENQTLAFRIIAESEGSQPKIVRLGVRGTAQVYSDRVSLAFYLFRRPISAARQWLGI
jgi:HlyD family secretion protein